MTIPSQITKPSGCKKKMHYSITSGNNRFCGLNLNGNKYLCPQCKSLQKSQAQVLLDEKKSELEFLDKVPNNRQDISKKLYKTFFDKIQELQEEIKVLEGLK